MITRITGTLEAIDGTSAVVAPSGSAGAGGAHDPGAFAYEVLLPAYLAESMRPRVGHAVTLVTLQYFEGQGQGSSFIPRLIGFVSARDRAFFELFTTVKGIGNRKALRALAVEPSRIARAIVGRDAKALVALPEVGKRLADTIIAELSGKVEAYLSVGESASLDRAMEVKAGVLPAHGEEAVEALVALGESRPEAERLVTRALGRVTPGGRAIKSADEVLGLVYAGR